MTTVFGNLKTLTAGLIPQGTVTFELSNIGTGNPITVSGVTVLPQLKYVAYSAADGSFSVSIYGNDVISPANTIYNITYRNAAGDEIGPIQYSITGSTFNLTSAGAINNISPPILAANVAVLTLLNQQGPLSPVVGTGADAVLYTYTIPANTIAAGQGIRVTAYWAHSTGSASVSYKLNLGGGTLYTMTSADASSGSSTVAEIFNNAGVQNAQHFSATNVLAGSPDGVTISNGTSSINLANSAVLSLTMNVANTDQVTPKSWLVEIINGPPNSIASRLMVSGSQLVSGDFALTGWGTGATIVPTTPSCDSAHSFTLTAGTGITSPPPNPTIQLTYHDGLWPNPPKVVAQIVGGTGVVSDLTITGTATAYTIAYQGWPPDSSTLIFNVLVVGQ